MKGQSSPRKVTLFIASSLDGFIARKDGGIDWLFTDGDYGYGDFYDSIDTVLMGRKTYELARKLGERFVGKTCYVFSRQKRRASEKNVRFVSNPKRFVKALVNGPGKGIFLEGGGETISLLLNAGLIDEIVLSIHPILLGNGIPLFRNVKSQTKLELLKSKPYDSGIVQSKYRVLKSE